MEKKYFLINRIDETKDQKMYACDTIPNFIRLCMYNILFDFT